MTTKAPKNLGGPDVVRAAIDVLDEVGLDGMTMRLIAQRLGVQPNTVYWHATSKPELLEMVADALLKDCVQGCEHELWSDRLVALLHRYRHALLVHRDGARVVAGTYSVMENTLALSEALTRTLLDAGFSPQVATWATWQSSALVLGLALEEQNEPQDWAQRLPIGVIPVDHPSVQAVTAHHVAGDHDARFAFSCDVLIRGLDSLLREAH